MVQHSLPQLDHSLFVTDAGCETDLIFNRGIPIRSFAAHTLLEKPEGRAALADYYRGFLTLAQRSDAGMVLDTVTWRAQPHWAQDLGATTEQLRVANLDAADFARSLREEFRPSHRPILVNGLIGPNGDAYSPENALTVEQAEQYHAEQVGWLLEAAVDMVTALTFTQSDEAVGVVRAANAVGLPVVVSFTVEVDGRLPTGQPLGEAIESVDDQTSGAPAYYMVNCAHPDHFAGVLQSPWNARISGLRCNASRRSHAELDDALELDAGDPDALAAGCLALDLPNLSVLGGCCGTDLRHVTRIVEVFQEASG